MIYDLTTNLSQYACLSPHFAAAINWLTQTDLAALPTDGNSIAIAGEDVALPPAAAQAIAMALHELATNAAKYGALSAPDGRVRVAWRKDAGGRLHLTWQETDGPKVTRPTRKGLGTNMLERALEGPLRGQTRLDWRETGLVCELELPLDAPAEAEVDAG